MSPTSTSPPPATPDSAPVANTALTIANILLAFLVLAITGGLIYARFFYEPEIDPRVAASYSAEAKERLAANADEIQQEVTALASTIVPPISRAVYEQAQEDFGLYVRTLEDEGDEYLASVEQMLAAQVREESRDYLRRHKQVLQEEFPNHASEENVERVLAEFEHVLTKLAERYYLDEFRRESQRTAAVWKKFEPVEVPGPGEPSLAEQLADYTADWAILTAVQPGKDQVAAANAE